MNHDNKGSNTPAYPDTLEHSTDFSVGYGRHEFSTVEANMDRNNNPIPSSPIDKTIQQHKDSANKKE